MKNFSVFLVSLLVAALLVGCGGQSASMTPQSLPTQNVSSIKYHLKTALSQGGMIFIGVGGEIAEMTNPTLRAKIGDTVSITLTSTEGIEHDIAIPDFNAKSQPVSGAGNSVTVNFIVDKPGTFPYFCSVPGHREAGMEGNIYVTGEAASVPDAANNGQIAATPMPGVGH